MTNPYIWRTAQEQSDHTAQLQLRKTQLTAMLTLRRGKPGFSANAIAIEAEIARVDEEIASGSDGASPDITPVGT